MVGDPVELPCSLRPARAARVDLSGDDAAVSRAAGYPAGLLTGTPAAASAVLDVADAQLAEVEDARGEHGVGTGLDRRREVLEPRPRPRWRSAAP